MMIILNCLEFLNKNEQLFVLFFHGSHVSRLQLPLNQMMDFGVCRAPEKALCSDAVVVAVELLRLADKRRLLAVVRTAEGQCWALAYRAHRGERDHCFRIN